MHPEVIQQPPHDFAEAGDEEVDQFLDLGMDDDGNTAAPEEAPIAVVNNSSSSSSGVWSSRPLRASSSNTIDLDATPPRGMIDLD